MSLVTSLGEAEGVGLAQPGGRRLGFPLCFPARHSLNVAWTGVEDHSPRPPGLDAVAALLGQDGEVAQGEVAVDALVDAAKLVGTLEGQDPPPAGFGLGRLARLAVQDGLAEMQLGVVGVDPEPSGTGVESRRDVSEHLVAAGDQGEELPHDGIGGSRPGQAAPEVPERCGSVLALDGDRAQVEEDERVIGTLGQLGLEDLAIALELAFPQRRVGVAGVPDRDLGPPHRDIRPPQRRQDLLGGPLGPDPAKPITNN